MLPSGLDTRGFELLDVGEDDAFCIPGNKLVDLFCNNNIS